MVVGPVERLRDGVIGMSGLLFHQLVEALLPQTPSVDYLPIGNYGKCNGGVVHQPK